MVRPSWAQFPEVFMAMMTVEDIGAADDVEVIARLVTVADRDLVDIGCGAGRLARDLAARGARVVAVEPDPVQAAANRAAEACGGVRFVEAPGEALPLADGVADGVIFGYSSHHVPAAALDVAFGEAIRVLRPSGFLLVLEPMPEGAFYDLIKPFHDEARDYARVNHALARVVAPKFARHRRAFATDSLAFDDFDGFVSHMAGSSYNEIERAAVGADAVRTRFDAGRADDGYRFTMRFRADLYQGLRKDI